MYKNKWGITLHWRQPTSYIELKRRNIKCLKEFRKKNLCMSTFQYVLGDMLDCHICYPVLFHQHCKIYEFFSLLHVWENHGLELVTGSQHDSVTTWILMHIWAMSTILLFTSQHKGGIWENMLIRVVNTTGSEKLWKVNLA